MQEPTIPTPDTPLSFGEIIFGLVLYPAQTMRTIIRQRPWRWAILTVLFLSVSSALILVLTNKVSQPLWLSLIMSIILSSLYLVIEAGIAHVISCRLAGGYGQYATLLCALAFVSLPLGIALALTPLILLIRPLLLILILLGIIWSLVLSFFAIRENYEFSNLEAGVVFVLTVGIIFLMNMGVKALSPSWLLPYLAGA